MKLFLLIAGLDYYPERSCSNWVDTFETKEEAESVVRHLADFDSSGYSVYGNSYDWYDIIDLSKWIEN